MCSIPVVARPTTTPRPLETDRIRGPAHAGRAGNADLPPRARTGVTWASTTAWRVGDPAQPTPSAQKRPRQPRIQRVAWCRVRPTHEGGRRT
jgi:hypothetical protein